MVVLFFIILAVALTDQISLMIKNSVDRLRPSHNPSLEGLIHLVNGQCGGIYGFVSSHASNTFNVAVLSLLLIKKRWYTSISILAWAASISYSRIYLECIIRRCGCRSNSRFTCRMVIYSALQVTLKELILKCFVSLPQIPILF
jgi:hypothetical protein